MYKLIIGNCEFEWNYYLDHQDGELFYDGYRQAKFSREENYWQLKENKKKLQMNLTENTMKYPAGTFLGHTTNLDG